jgi:hypothetical protein
MEFRIAREGAAGERVGRRDVEIGFVGFDEALDDLFFGCLDDGSFRKARAGRVWVLPSRSGAY